MRKRGKFFLASLLIVFCSTPFKFAMGGIALQQDGGTTCTINTSTVQQQNETIITQTTNCSDGTSQVCTTIITNSSTSRTCDDNPAANYIRGCKFNA